MNWTDGDKQLWHKKMSAYAREIAKAMGLEKGEFEVRSNKAGIAVLGEVMLHTEHVYVCFGGSVGSPTFFYRGCLKGGFKARDYGTGMSGLERNRHLSYESIRDLQGIADTFRTLQDQVKRELVNA